MEYRLPIPKNWQDFESICHRLWSDIWMDPNAKKNGRQGQNQNGVDIYGKPVYSKKYHGIQCKDKDGRLGSFFKTDELEKESKKAINFRPSIGSFTIATTSSRNQNIQEFYRELNEKSIFPFEVNVWSWDDIETEIVYRPLILQHFYPSLVGIYDNQNQIKLNRYSAKDNLDAFFTRPGLRDNLSNKFKSYLRPLIYELADNAYEHGKGTEFKIEIENKRIKLSDNGTEFNPFKNLNPMLVSSLGNVGSFVLHTFLERFKGSIEVNYRREENLNITEFVFDEKILKIDDDNFYEMNIDLQLVYGREAMKELVKYIPYDKKEVIVIIEQMGALSSFIQFVKEALIKIGSNQQLILSLPRHEYLDEIQSWFQDERLVIKTR